MTTDVLTIRLLGAVVISRDEQEVGTLSRSAKCLLALLILRRNTSQTRRSLAALLWQDAPHELGLFYLRRCLTELRTALGSERERLISDSGTLRFETKGMVCDALAFERLTVQKDEAAWEQAVALYRGSLLEGIEADWLTGERERFAALSLTVLEKLAGLREQCGALPEAIQLLRRVVVQKPLHESAYCHLMKLASRTGGFAEVEQIYRELRRALRSELNLEPSAETVQCYQRLKAQSQTLAPAPPVPTPRLPLPLTSLVGRSQERLKIAALLQYSRLVTLLGPGGVGKTRLSLAVAEDIAASFAHGVWFADLAPVTTEETLPQAVLASLDCQPSGEMEPLEALCRFLNRKRLLLILDNAEHLRERCARLAKHLLQECPLLTILCTSREPLGISGEAMQSVVPLAVPPVNDPNRPLSEQEIAAYDSVVLLLARIAAAAPTFRLTSYNVAAIAQICRRLDGLPLALELVAARFRTLSASDIAAKLDEQFRLLTGGDPSNPRHRTLRAALDWSYTLLDEAERRLLRSVSVFTGGWTLEAAEAVCSDENADIFALLSSLVDKSLIVVDEQSSQTRYRLLEMTRAYAAERRDADEEDLLRQRHALFFMAMAQRADEGIIHNQPLDDRTSLRSERENFRVAYSWWLGHDTEQALYLELFLYGVWIWTVSSKREWIVKVAAAEPKFSPLGARLTFLTASWAMWLGDPTAERLLRQAIAISEACGCDYWAISAWSVLSEWYQENGQIAEALSCIESALAAQRQEQNPYSFARLNAEAAALMVLLGAEQTARARLKTLLVQGRRAGDLRTLFYIVEGLAKIAYSQKQYSEAYGYLREYLQIAVQYQPFDVPEAWRRMGNAAREQGDYTEAQRCYESALTTSRIQNRRDREAWTYCGMAVLASRQDDLAGALERLALASALFEELDEPRSIAQCLRMAAEYHLTSNSPERAALILGSVERTYAEYAFSGIAAENAEIETLNAQLRSRLSHDELEQCKKRGAMMLWKQATEYAFETGLH